MQLYAGGRDEGSELASVKSPTISRSYLRAEDISVDQAERVLLKQEIVTLMPDTARQYAVEAIELRRREGHDPKMPP